MPFTVPGARMPIRAAIHPPWDMPRTNASGMNGACRHRARPVHGHHGRLPTSAWRCPTSDPGGGVRMCTRGERAGMRPVRALVALLLAALALTALSACGSGDDRLSELQRRAEQTRHKLEARADRLRRRVREVLASLEQAVPQATPETQSPATRGRTEQNEIEGFLTDVLGSVARYWTRTLSAAARPEPRVGYVWVPPGQAVGTGCGAPADENAAFYCANDDTIYFSEGLAARLWQG